MRKACIFLLLLSLLLTSCGNGMAALNWGGEQILVPWYVVAIPVGLFLLVVFVCTQRALTNREYVCSKCGEVFTPRWYQISVWMHWNDMNLLKCPKCGHKGFFVKKSS